VGFIKVTGNIVLIDCVAMISSESEIVMKLHDIVTTNTVHTSMCILCKTKPYTCISLLYPSWETPVNALTISP